MAHALLAAATLLIPNGAPASGPQKLDGQDWLIFGSVSTDRQPDGNTLVMTGPKGAIVFDTGRHKDHSDRIEAQLKTLAKPLVAIVNSHWHLDHVSGNPRLKAAYPRAQAWSSNAIDGALGGFLKRGLENNRAAIAGGKLTAGELEEREAAVATVEAGDTLRPDHVVAGSGRVMIAGRKFDLHLARRAATEADVWLYDPAHKRAIIGDLVTYPAPFLDTACPRGWKAALAEVAATPFNTVIPGHGPVMDRGAFNAWRSAFTAFVDCAEGQAPLDQCTAGWLAYARPLDLKASRIDMSAVADYAGYYADLLRRGTLDTNCKANSAT